MWWVSSRTSGHSHPQLSKRCWQKCCEFFPLHNRAETGRRSQSMLFQSQWPRPERNSNPNRLYVSKRRVFIIYMDTLIFGNWTMQVHSRRIHHGSKGLKQTNIRRITQTTPTPIPTQRISFIYTRDESNNQLSYVCEALPSRKSQCYLLALPYPIPKYIFFVINFRFWG